MKRLMLLLPLCGLLLGASCGPQPNPTPTPTPTPIPPPAGCQCVVPLSTDSGWQNVTADSPQEEKWNEEFFVEGRDAIGDVCGKDQDMSRTRMFAWFTSHNICAGLWPTAIIAARPDGYWEEWDVVNSDGCWRTVPMAYKGIWKNTKAKSCDHIGVGRLAR